MKIAVFINSETMSTLDEHFVRAIVLKVADNTITSIDKEFLSTENINRIGLWLLTRKINVLYIQDFNEEIRAFLERIGVVVKNFKDLKNDNLIKLFDLF